MGAPSPARSTRATATSTPSRRRGARCFQGLGRIARPICLILVAQARLARVSREAGRVLAGGRYTARRGRGSGVAGVGAPSPARRLRVTATSTLTRRTGVEPGFAGALHVLAI